MLQKTLKDLKESSRNESTDVVGNDQIRDDRANDKTIIEQLSSKIKELTESLHFIQSEREKVIQLEKEKQDIMLREFDTKYDKTLADLVKAEYELGDAKLEIKNLTTSIEELKQEYDNEIREILSKSKIELDSTKSKMEEQLNTVQAKSNEEKDALGNQIMKLKGILLKTEVKVVDLEMELAKTVKDMNNEIISTKAVAKKELDATLVVMLRTQRDAEEKAVIIENLENERASIRKLMRLQAGLVKSRVGKLFQKRGTK